MAQVPVLAEEEYLLAVYTWDSVREKWITGRYKIDGNTYEGSTIFVRLPPGRHTIEMTLEGYEFEKWVSRSGDSWHEVTFDDPYRNPTGFIMPSGMAFIYCFVHEAPPPGRWWERLKWYHWMILASLAVAGAATAYYLRKS